MIIDHDHWQYRERWQRAGQNRWNGAFFYSKEIVKNIIPNVKTDRNWITVNEEVYGENYNHSIVFIHNNLHPENYDWLKKWKDLVLVCGIKETCKKVKHLGKAIYLPLSVDVKDLMKYKIEEHDRDCAYIGRITKLKNPAYLPRGCDIITDLPRTKILQEMAHYKKVYAVGRCAIEALVLGCELGVCDDRFPDTKIWKIVDNSEAVQILQKELDKIDKKSA